MWGANRELHGHPDGWKVAAEKSTAQPTDESSKTSEDENSTDVLPAAGSCRRPASPVEAEGASDTSNAEKFATSVSDSIVLIDGERLTELMIEYGVGVQTERTVRVVEVEWNYFEEE